MRRNALLGISLLLFANVQAKYSLNSTRGLPDDHVYNIIKDMAGYLWFTTPHGIVRYNGYECRVFNTMDGLANEDIWFATPDKKNRIWLSTISGELGYIYNDQYTRLSYSSMQLYPQHPISTSNGIAFCSSFNGKCYLYMANNTFTNIALPMMSSAYLTDNRELVCNTGNYFWRYSINNLGKITIKKLSRFRSDEINDKGSSLFYVWKHYVVFCKYQSPDLWIIDLDDTSGRLTKLSYDQKVPDAINYVEYNQDYLYVIKNNNISIKDTNLQTVKTIRIDTLLNNDIHSADVTFFVNDTLWGTCLATSSNGVYMNLGKDSHFQKCNAFNLSNYEYIGSTSDSQGYWWNTSSKILAEIINNKKIQHYRYRNIASIKKIIPYSRQKSLLIEANDLYWFDNKTKHLSYYLSDTQFEKCGYYNLRNCFAEDILFKDNDIIYGIFHGKGKLSRFGPRYHNIEVVDPNVYKKIVYDSASKSILVFNGQKILVIGPGDKKAYINSDVIKQSGIKVIESLYTDSYGNIFIKDFDKIWLYDRKCMSLQQLFPGYRLNNALITIYHHTLVIASLSGVLFSKINGYARISSPVVYRNKKNANYSRLMGMQVSLGKILLNTDEGLYFIDIPNRKEFLQYQKNDVEDYRLIAMFSDHSQRVKNNDTISLDQDNPIIQLDVINPYGVGKVRYRCWEGDTEIVLNTNVLNLSNIKAGEYRAISVIAYDNVWQSSKMHIHAYKKPFWWQTSVAIRWIWIAGIFIFAAIVMFISIIATKVVTSRNEEKNRLLELELKSIYAQINPHFVFNSLLTALYFVKERKVNEAYLHILKFSKLLRSYIWSSRNKKIQLSAEIENLTMYIELQQVRFENKFTYLITVDESINSETVIIPALLLQPLVENAIQHGLLPANKEGHLNISFERNEHDFVCIIDDDGVGRKDNRKEDTEGIKKESFGTSLIQDLMNIVNKYEHIEMNLKYIDKQLPLTGTRAILTIKNIL